MPQRGIVSQYARKLKRSTETKTGGTKKKGINRGPSVPKPVSIPRMPTKKTAKIPSQRGTKATKLTIPSVHIPKEKKKSQKRIRANVFAFPQLQFIKIKGRGKSK